MNKEVNSDLIIFDDVYPDKISIFRTIEFNEYLNLWENAKIVTANNNFSTGSNLYNEHFSENPSHINKVIRWENTLSYNAKLAYVVFFNNLIKFDLGFSIKIPFIVNLYPGGGFQINSTEHDKLYKKYFFSPYLRKVIVTQKIIYDYLIENNLCPKNKIEYIFGVVLSNISSKNDSKKYFFADKETLDICFTAYKYSEKGEDKGFDTFVKAAEILSLKYQNIKFHVVGNFTKNDVGALKVTDDIIFYGVQQENWFDKYYQDKDIIVSPNAPFVLAEGSFDGFPTASVSEASIRDVAMIVTDTLNLNNNNFIEDEEIVIVNNDADEIAAKIDYFYNNPDVLKSISNKGCLKSKQIYSKENQIGKRKEIISYELNNRTTIPVMHCFDNNYTIQAAISMYSMLKHANTSNYYILYVLHTDITTQNQEKLKQIVSDFSNAELIFIDMNHRFENLWREIAFSGHYSKEVLYKLVTPSIFPQHDKIIITDVDVVFLSDIADSYYSLDANIEALVAGVKHICPSDSWLDSYYNTNYINNFGEGSLEKLKVCGGYLVFHLENMRKQHTEQIFLEYLNHNASILLQSEQDVINFCLDDKDVILLPLEYVVCTYMYDIFDDPSKLNTDHYYKANEIVKALKNPVQLHYATNIKPWNTISCTKSEIWYDYLAQCGMTKEHLQKLTAQMNEEPVTINTCSNIEIVEECENKNLVSVLCCTYNHGEFLKNTLDSILAQETNFDFEIIVADDASTDNSQQIIREFQAKFPNKLVSILREANVGIGNNYYEALNLVKGKYLAICDGDDYWIDKNKLQLQVDFMENNAEFNICCSSFEQHYVNGNSKNKVFYINEYLEDHYLLKEYYTFKDLLNCRFIASCTVLMRWKLKNNVPEFLKHYKIIDFPLLLIHSSFGKIKVMNDYIFSQYNIHTNGITKSTDPEAIHESLKMIIKEVNQFLDYKMDKTVQKYLSFTQENPEQTEPESIYDNIKPQNKIIYILSAIYKRFVPERIKNIYRKLKTLI